MKLSVIIPVYNGADFVEKSYNSIINQNLDDFELLYVNNNSNDDSASRIQAFVDKDVRVKLLQQPIQGTSFARNMGISKATGDYVYIFDVDDEIYPNALNSMMSVLDSHPDMEAVFGKMVKSYKGILETIKPDDETHQVILNDKPYWGLRWFSSLKHVVGPPAFLYRRDVFSKIGAYNVNIKNTEDTAFDIKLGMTSNVAFLDTYVYLYFKHASSTIEMAKKNEDLVAIHWTRFVKSHLPFYFNNTVPIPYKQRLYSYIFKTTAKRISQVEGASNRRLLLNDLLIEVEPMKFPTIIRLYLMIITIFPLSFLLKFYFYYIVPFYIRNRIETL
jgi:glycosyltransferase involved in cell wall biosynthesis